MKTILATAAALGLLASPALALDPELEELNRTVFDSVDVNGDGALSLREIELFRHYHR